MMGNIKQQPKKDTTGQRNSKKRSKTGYIPVSKHSQKKEHPDTFVVSIRVPYIHHAKYRGMDIEQRNGLRKVIEDYFSLLAE